MVVGVYVGEGEITFEEAASVYSIFGILFKQG